MREARDNRLAMLPMRQTRRGAAAILHYSCSFQDDEPWHSSSAASGKDVNSITPATAARISLTRFPSLNRIISLPSSRTRAAAYLSLSLVLVRRCVVFYRNFFLYILFLFIDFTTIAFQKPRIPTPLLACCEGKIHRPESLNERPRARPVAAQASRRR